jgi:fatty acid synthase
LRLGEKFPLKAGLVTSLGFGHVSGLIALVHPQAFLAALSAEQRADYTGGPRSGCWPDSAGWPRPSPAGGRCMKPADRRFDHDQPEKRQEAAMLLDPASRLGDGDTYVR